MSGTFDPNAPFGERYPLLNAHPEPLALALALPSTSTWFRRPKKLVREVSGARIHGALARVDLNKGWEPGNVIATTVPPHLLADRERERQRCILPYFAHQGLFDRRTQTERAREWETAVATKRYRARPGRPPDVHRAFMYARRIEDWAMDFDVGVSTIRRRLKAGEELEEILLDAERRWLNRRTR